MSCVDMFLSVPSSIHTSMTPSGFRQATEGCVAWRIVKIYQFSDGDTDVRCDIGVSPSMNSKWYPLVPWHPESLVISQYSWCSDVFVQVSLQKLCSAVDLWHYWFRYKMQQEKIAQFWWAIGHWSETQMWDWKIVRFRGQVARLFRKVGTWWMG